MQRGFALAFIKSAVAGVRADSAKLRFKKSYDGLTIKSGTGHTLRRRLYPQRNHIFSFLGPVPRNDRDCVLSALVIRDCPMEPCHTHF